MTHPLDGDFGDEIAKPKLNPAFALHIEQLAGEEIRAWTGIGTLTFGGYDWQGTGSFGTLDAARETTDGTAVGLKATLNEIPAELGVDIDAMALRGGRMDVYVLAVDESWTEVVGQPKLVWRGEVDKCDITDNGDTINVAVQGETSARAQRRPAVKRYTDQYQQSKYPGDLFFQYLPSLAEVPILWARAAQATAEGGALATGGAMLGLGR